MCDHIAQYLNWHEAEMENARLRRCRELTEAAAQYAKQREAEAKQRKAKARVTSRYIVANAVKLARMTEEVKTLIRAIGSSLLGHPSVRGLPILPMSGC